MISVVFRAQQGIFPPGQPFTFEDQQAATFIRCGLAVPAGDDTHPVELVEQFVDPNVDVLNDDSLPAKAARREKWKGKDAAAPLDRQAKAYVRKGGK